MLNMSISTLKPIRLNIKQIATKTIMKYIIFKPPKSMLISDIKKKLRAQFYNQALCLRLRD